MRKRGRTVRSLLIAAVEALSLAEAALDRRARRRKARTSETSPSRRGAAGARRRPRPRRRAVSTP